MFKKKSAERPKRTHAGNLSQFGMFDIPKDFNPMDPMGGSMDSDGGDSDLEAELAALAGGGGTKPKPKKPAKQPIMSQTEFNTMVQLSLKDDTNEDEDVDENDPDLLSELNEIAGDDSEPSTESPSKESSPVNESTNNVLEVLSKRLQIYLTVESDAKAAGETSKARRYGRAIKTLNDLIKKAKAGVDINLNDDSIPPEITIKPKEPQTDDPSSGNSENNSTVLSPTRPAPALPPKPELPLPDVVQQNVTETKNQIDEELLNMLLERQKQFKIAALQSKKSGDTEKALKYVKIAKQFDNVIEAVKSGQSVDLSNMPELPGEVSESKLQQSESQKQASTEIDVPEAANDLPEPELMSANTIDEALQQRLQFYKIHEQKAKDEENSSKARRFGRIVKQFEQALKAYKAGKTVAYDELPTPPGFAPLPVPGSGAPISGESPMSPKPTVAPKPSPKGENIDNSNGTSPKPSSRISGNKVSTSHQEKQVLILQAKQKQFKMAALNAKKKGELTEAKEFLRQAHGFNKLIEAAQAGLPVDWGTIPISPEAKSQLDNEYDIVMAEECTEDDGDADMLSRLETQLTKQLKMCLSTRDHNKALGDVAGTHRFERLALNVTKDLDVIRSAKRYGHNVPKFHFEPKDFSIVKCFTELTDNDLELVIMRGINYKTEAPTDIDTYVKFEFPFPQETPYSDKTSTVKDTNNPTYNQTFVIPIQRSSRQCQRVFKRHGIKFEVYSKGGFFRSDSLVGTVNLKLQPLETQCEIHDSFDVMDGRRKTGGKLEIRLRLRSPIVTQQVEQIQEKWYLGSGCSFKELHYTYRVGSTTASQVVKKVCEEIWKVLLNECMPKLNTEKWKTISDTFEQRANFPHCIGAVDGKHIRLIKPIQSASLYYNYKNYYSINLMAVADANYNFIYVDVGAYGKDADSTIFQNCSLWNKLENGTLDLPRPSIINGIDIPMPFAFVGDDAFPLSKHVLKPFKGKLLSKEKRIFNYRLCRARRYVECTFGIFANKWRIFLRPLDVAMESAIDIVKACCLLHNFVRNRDGYVFEDSLTVPGLEDNESNEANFVNKSTGIYREKLKIYFISESGRLAWQCNKI